MRLDVFVLILILYHTLSQVRTRGTLTQRNIVSSFTNRTNSMDFFFKSRFRYGYFFVAFSKYNDSFQDSYVFAAWQDDSNWGPLGPNVTVYRYISPNYTTKEIPKVLYSPKPFYIQDERNADDNYFPIGRYNNDMNLNIRLPKKDFTITSETWIIMGFSYSNRPKSPSDLGGLDEWEKCRFDYINGEENQFFHPYARLEYISFELFVIEICFYVFLLFLCSLLYIYEKKPLYSRGFFPFIAIIGHLIHLISGITQYIFTLEDFKYNCIFLYFLQQTIVLTLLFLTIFYFFRYISIVNLNIGKNDLYKKNFQTSKLKTSFLKLKIRVLRIFSSNYFLLMFTFGLCLFINTIYFIGFLSTNLKCDRSVFWSYIIYISGIIIFFILLFVLFISDMITNYRKFLECRILDFWREDKQWYRFEIYFFSIFVTLPTWFAHFYANPDAFQIKAWSKSNQKI